MKQLLRVRQSEM